MIIGSIRKALAAFPLLCLLALGGHASMAQGVLRIAMTAADVPTTTGAPTQGLEGVRFAGYPVFEPLVMWDLRQTDEPPAIIPWLATSWKTDPTDRNKWIFVLRQGVTFHDGSLFDADAVVFSLGHFFDKAAPQYEPAAAASNAARAAAIAKWEKIDDHTVAIYTTTPTTYFPEILAGILIESPRQFERLGKSWQAFAAHPSGTGAFRITAVDSSSITLEKNPGYWNTGRAAKLDKVVLYPMPEPTTRLAALRSGQVDWIEVPPPDAIPGLTQAGFTVATSPFPQIWPYWLKIADATPFKDVRVRQALNYAMDREGLVALLNGSAEPAKGFWKTGDPRFGHPQNDYKYDPAKARSLLAAAGYKDQLVPVRVLISTSGSGQMLPEPMNELLQQSARDAGFDLSFSVVDFAQMAALRNRPGAPEMKDVIAMNASFTTADMTWFYYSFYPPNWPGSQDSPHFRLWHRGRTFRVDP